MTALTQLTLDDLKVVAATGQAGTPEGSLISLEPSLRLWATMAPWGLGKHKTGAWVWRQVGDKWLYVGRTWLTTEGAWAGEVRTAPKQFAPLPTGFTTLQSCARAMVEPPVPLA